HPYAKEPAPMPRPRPQAGYPTWPNWPSVQVRLGFWALVPTWSTPSAPHERAGQEAKSHISPRCNYVSSRERDVCMYRGRCLRDPLHVCSGMARWGIWGISCSDLHVYRPPRVGTVLDMLDNPS